MIYVTSGHESGIGLEIFLKSYLLLAPLRKKHIALIIAPDVLQKNLSDLNLPMELFKDLHIIKSGAHSPFHSTNSLLTALSLMGPRDILVTLPTSKDQLFFQKKHWAGYTEFFRAYFKNKDISMVFHGMGKNILLITDHIPVSAISANLSSDLVFNKLALTLKDCPRFTRAIEDVIVAGLNPHAGEKGLLGHEEACIADAINRLRQDFPQQFMGPLPADTLHVYENPLRSQLFVYMYHDQGLTSFKSQMGWIGLNISLGLPFLRLSVDHGTAFELYGKNKANFTGMIYLLNKAFEVHRVDQ